MVLCRDQAGVRDVPTNDRALFRVVVLLPGPAVCFRSDVHRSQVFGDILTSTTQEGVYNDIPSSFAIMTAAVSPIAIATDAVFCKSKKQLPFHVPVTTTERTLPTFPGGIDRSENVSHRSHRYEVTAIHRPAILRPRIP